MQTKETQTHKQKQKHKVTKITNQQKHQNIIRNKLPNNKLVIADNKRKRNIKLANIQTEIKNTKTKSVKENKTFKKEEVQPKTDSQKQKHTKIKFRKKFLK